MQTKHKQLKEFIIISALLIFGFAYFIWLNKAPSPPSIPEEAKTAYKALEKLQAATQTGVSFDKYTELLIEARAAVNSAEFKLPVISEKILRDGYDPAPEYRLENINFKMQKAMDAYQSAKTAWWHKITNKNLSDTPEGKLVLSKYAFLIAPNMDGDTAIQKLWDRADTTLETLHKLIEN